MNRIPHFVLVLLMLGLALPLSACGRAADPRNGDDLTGTIIVSGAFALYPMMITWAEEYQALHPGVRIDVSAGGAGKGMADTLAGAVDIGMVSRDITPEEEASGAYGIAVTRDAVFTTVNAQNPVLERLLQQGITPKTLAGLYLDGSLTTWGQVIDDPSVTAEVHVFTRSDASGAAEIWAKFMGKKQEDLLGIGVFGDPGILEAVVKDPLGIGYNNLNYAFDAASGAPVAGAAVVPIDLNQNGMADPDEMIDSRAGAVQAVASGRYPSPPARTLYLVTRDKPAELAQNFLLWILTDGQQFVDVSGYVQLSADLLESQLARVR
jgi:phosphate transport system substrate-binding protein